MDKITKNLQTFTIELRNLDFHLVKKLSAGAFKTYFILKTARPELPYLTKQELIAWYGSEPLPRINSITSWLLELEDRGLIEIKLKGGNNKYYCRAL